MRVSLKPILTALAVAAVCVVSTAVAFFLQHHESRPVSAQVAHGEFLQLRTRFAGQQPLLDMQRRRASVQQPTRASGRVRAIHTVIFDTRGRERLVRISVPYWFARAFARHDGEYRWLGELTFLDDTEFDPEPIELSLDQIERHGPGLLVDYRHGDGGRFIVWAD
jgi:hypothetical protein